MKKFVIVFFAALMLLSSCTYNQKTENMPSEETLDDETPINTETVSALPKVTPAPTAEPEIFDINSVSDKSLNGLLRNQNIPDETIQLILVAVGQRDDKMYLMEKQENGMWLVVHGPFDVQLGKNGMDKEEEGDGKSPEGIFELGYAFGRDAAPDGTIWPWRTSEPGDIWVEDSDSKYYNMYIKDGTVEEPDWEKFSNLNILAFARAVEIRYNSQREPGAGSAIFLHIWLSPTKGTNGCTAISRENIETVIRWLDPKANTMIAQLQHELVGQGDLVYLTDFDYDIKADIRFAQEDNILGTVLEGYNANQIITKANTAMALVKANEMFKDYGVKLVVYDAYRPMAAFYQIRNWLDDPEDIASKETYYKDMDKEALGKEYFSYNSDKLYTRAQVVHVSLVDLSGEPFDMGGDYMAFDEFTHYACDGLTQQQIYNRELLHDIMIQAGFTSVDNQWWKFEYNPYLYDVKYDEIIE